MATPFHAELVTPERVLFSGDVDEVTMRTDEGEISFLAGHEDYIAAADVTVVRLSVVGGSARLTTGAAGAGASASATGAARPGGGGPGLPGGAAPEEGSGVELLVAVHGGFVQVDREGVVILASVAELAAEIDVDRARRAFDDAQAALPGGDRPADEILAEASAVSGNAGIEVPAGGPAPSAAPVAMISPTPSMLALLAPDSPEVRRRRARARLAAAGVAAS